MYEYLSGTAAASRRGNWDPAVLDSLAEINEQVLEVLGGEGRHLFPYASSLSPLLAAEWRALDPEGRVRLAASPYLLLDCQFENHELWRVPLHAGVRDASDKTEGFARALGAQTLRHAVLLAWHWSRANPLTAQIALGLSESGTAQIAGTRLRDLEARVDGCPDWIRPRWENRPAIWRQLLAAAAPVRGATLRQLHLRGLQLLAAGGPGA